MPKYEIAPYRERHRLALHGAHSVGQEVASAVVGFVTAQVIASGPTPIDWGAGLVGAIGGPVIVFAARYLWRLWNAPAVLAEAALADLTAAYEREAAEKEQWRTKARRFSREGDELYRRVIETLVAGDELASRAKDLGTILQKIEWLTDYREWAESIRVHLLPSLGPLDRREIGGVEYKSSGDQLVQTFEKLRHRRQALKALAERLDKAQHEGRQ